METVPRQPPFKSNSKMRRLSTQGSPLRTPRSKDFSTIQTKLTGRSIKLRCAKIGLSKGSAGMGASVNLPTVTIRWFKRENPRTPNISQRGASSSMRRISALMVLVVSSSTKTDLLRRFTPVITASFSMA